MNKISEIKELVYTLNTYRDEYYNQNAPSISDSEYDKLFDKLKLLEKETGFILANSPTVTVGFTAVSELESTTHNIPLLSLDKTKSIDELIKFSNGQPMLLMHKMDGLTVKLTYENGELIEASTRGDGTTGEVITHNAKYFSGVPLKIPHHNRLVITGEAFIKDDDFKILKETLLDSKGKKYSNSRNLAAGSARLLDSSISKDRKISFIPFNVLEGLENDSKLNKLYELRLLGFELCQTFLTMGPCNDKDWLSSMISTLRDKALEKGIPIDGIVVTFNDIAYSKEQGRTEHHYKDGIAFKFEDETFETTLKSIEWTPSRTGEISPVAILEPVEIDGTLVSRASLHNLSFIKELELMPNCKVLVCKRNMIIPHIENNLDRGNFDAETIFPKTCSCCNQPTRIHRNTNKDKVTETLYCDNEQCETRNLRKFTHFVSKKAMDIDGLSEATLEKFIGKGFLHTPIDIYFLDEHESEIIQMDGFGEKSYQRLQNAIEESKNTTFERFVISMDIPMIGNSASRELCKSFENDIAKFKQALDDGFDFTNLSDFGETLHNNITLWFKQNENRMFWDTLHSIVTIKRKEENIMTNNIFTGKTIVVTGKVEPYTRDGINAVITSLGATPGSSVSKNTDYLICGAKAGSKLEKAQSLGITVLSPEEFAQMTSK